METNTGLMPGDDEPLTAMLRLMIKSMKAYGQWSQLFFILSLNVLIYFVSDTEGYQRGGGVFHFCDNRTINSIILCS